MIDKAIRTLCYAIIVATLVVYILRATIVLIILTPQETV